MLNGCDPTGHIPLQSHHPDGCEKENMYIQIHGVITTNEIGAVVKVCVWQPRLRRLILSRNLIRPYETAFSFLPVWRLHRAACPFHPDGCEPSLRILIFGKMSVLWPHHCCYHHHLWGSCLWLLPAWLGVALKIPDFTSSSTWLQLFLGQSCGAISTIIMYL